MHDANSLGIDAEDLVRDLRERGLQALAVRVRADADLETAIRRQTGMTLLVPRHHRNTPAVIDARSMCRLLAVNREADTDAATIALTPLLPLAPVPEIERLDGATHGFRIVARVEVLLGDVVVGHLVRLNEIHEPHLMRFLARRTRHRIERDFERETHARSRDTAVRQDAR